MDAAQLLNKLAIRMLYQENINRSMQQNYDEA